MAQTTRNIKLHLVGTHTRYSSWTSRVVLLFEYYRIPHERTLIKLKDVPASSKSALVPFIKVEIEPDTSSFVVNDSLSICEFVAEQFPDLPLWPKDWQLRALARSATAEMHSGFNQIRNDYPTNFLGKYTGAIPISDRVRKELTRLFTVWAESRATTVRRLKELGQEADDDGFLFGAFGIADAFYWPVLWRLRSYNLPIDDAPESVIIWLERMWNNPIMRAQAEEYFLQAEDPETVIEHYEDVFAGNSNIQYDKFEKGWAFQYQKR